MPAAGVTQTIQAWLSSTWHIQVPQTWLDACVEWVTEEAGGVALPQTQLNQQVLDQWLLTDLRDLAHPVLPAGISEAEKLVLNGWYCLQMDSILDVSQPAYSQLQRLRGSDCSNDDVSAVTQATQRPWEAKPTRMLMLQITDGVQYLEGIEYRPIPALSANLPPGTKLQVVGMVMVRLGVLLLKPENIRVLGGEVEELMETFSQSRVLCKTLGLPEESRHQEAEHQEVQQGGRIEGTLDSGYESTASSMNTQMTSRNEPRQLENSRLSTLEATPISRQSGPNVVDIPDDDFDDFPDDFMDYPEDAGNIPDSDHDHRPDHGPDDWGNNSDDFNNGPEDFDDIPLEELDDMMSPTDPDVLPSRGPVDNNRAHQKDVSSTDYLVNQPQTSNHLNLHFRSPPSEANPGVEVVEVDSDDNPSPSPEPKMARYESRTQISDNTCSKKAHTAILSRPRAQSHLSLSSKAPLSEANPSEVIEIDADDDSSSSPESEAARDESGSHKVPAHNSSKKPDTSILNYLCNLKAGVWPPRSAQVVRLHAFIVTLLGSLRSSGGEWKVKATISDGTGYLDVDLSDGLLANLIGFSAAESKVLRKDPSKRGMVDAGIQRCQRGLVDMCCVLTVQVDPNGTGTVLRADPLTDRVCCEIQKRVTDRKS